MFRSGPIHTFLALAISVSDHISWKMSSGNFHVKLDRNISSSYNKKVKVANKLKKGRKIRDFLTVHFQKHGNYQRSLSLSYTRQNTLYASVFYWNHLRISHNLQCMQQIHLISTLLLRDPLITVELHLTRNTTCAISLTATFLCISQTICSTYFEIGNESICRRNFHNLFDLAQNCLQASKATPIYCDIP